MITLMTKCAVTTTHAVGSSPHTAQILVSICGEPSSSETPPPEEIIMSRITVIPIIPIFIH